MSFTTLGGANLTALVVDFVFFDGLAGGDGGALKCSILTFGGGGGGTFFGESCACDAVNKNNGAVAITSNFFMRYLFCIDADHEIFHKSFYYS